MLTSNLPLTLITFYYMLLAGSVFFNVKVPARQSQIINFIFLLSIVVLSYNFVPDPSLDLFRYYNYLDELKNVSWTNIFNHGGYRNTVITQLYFYIISLIDNYSILSLIPTTVLFIIIFNVANNFREQKQITFQAYALFIIGIISMANLSGIISGIRQNFSWVLMMYAVYYDYYKKPKQNNWRVILYLLPLMVHLSALPFVLLRIIMPVFKYFPKLQWLLLIWPLTIVSVDMLRLVLPPVFNEPLARLVNYTSLSISLSPRILITLFGYLIILLFLYKINKNTELTQNESFLKYYSSVVLFGVASFIVPVLYVRTFQFIMYLSLPIYSGVFKSDNRFDKLLVNLLLALFIVMFYYGDLHAGDPFLR